MASKLKHDPSLAKKSAPGEQRAGDLSEAAKGTWTLTIKSYREASLSEIISKGLRGAEDIPVGHAWILLEAPSREEDSWGYWPVTHDFGVPWRDVPGKVRHPDEAHRATAQHAYHLSPETAAKVIDAADAREASPGTYNLFTNNCTTFVTDMAKVAKVSAPSFGHLEIANPSSLEDKIAGMNQLDGHDLMDAPMKTAPHGAKK